MVQKALEVLQHNPAGYVLFVEGGRIDHAHHDLQVEWDIVRALFRGAIVIGQQLVQSVRYSIIGDLKMCRSFGVELCVGGGVWSAQSVNALGTVSFSLDAFIHDSLKHYKNKFSR